ncbi:Hypothetical predicted protein [Marmota monax]|uniref:AH domain-containing protein n=1 Tax=Marmota monax TaxID=9995 RepID=A0A5E4DI56_MARMO|nr:Hypothetical predicted protein [Marmota monax]
MPAKPTAGPPSPTPSASPSQTPLLCLLSDLPAASCFAMPATAPSLPGKRLRSPCLSPACPLPGWAVSAGPEAWLLTKSLPPTARGAVHRLHLGGPNVFALKTFGRTCAPGLAPVGGVGTHPRSKSPARLSFGCRGHLQITLELPTLGCSLNPTDGLVKRLEELERTAELYKGMTEHTKNLLRAFYELSQTHRAFGDVFSVIGVREPQPAASEAFVKFADAHRSMEKFGVRLLKTIKPMLTDLNTYLNKAIPDTRLTIRKYLDVKFEYLSYCLKVKEMDDEEYSCIALGEPLYRVSTGNYEYRLILRCRQEARARFSQMRKDVLEKMELLDQKHVQDIVFQLQRFVSTMSKYYNDCYSVLRDADVFPIEVDLAHTTLAYGLSQGEFTDGEEEEEEEEDTAAREPSRDLRGAAGPLDKGGSWCDS